MTHTQSTPQKRFKLLPEMEGPMARWYARQRGSASQMPGYRQQATRLTRDLPDGAAILEVAPGPGYHAVEMARLGRFTVTGLDVSRTMVEIASDYARQAGVSVDFRHGDAAGMPFGSDSFDLIVCQAAFKNFTQPVRALDEMHRVLRAGGTAVIQDLSKDATSADIDREVGGMGLGRFSAFFTKRALAGLRRRAYTRGQFERLAAESAFRTCTADADGIGLEVRLTKRAA